MKKIIAFVASLLILSSAFAQEISNSAYFLDGYALKHEFNPAFASARNYLALPALSGINVSTRSPLGLSTFVYPSSNGLKLFTSSEVNAQTFLSKLKSNNKLLVGANVNVLSVGFWNKSGGFVNFGINLKVDAGANIPYDLFDFVKNIGAKETYNISNLGVTANSYAEIYGGFSRDINSNLRIGGKVKVLVGIAAADLNISKLQLQLSENKWIATTQASAKFYSAPGTFKLENNADGNIDFSKFNVNPNMKEPIGGFGAALDLGAVYEGFVDGLKISAAIKDLGFISWNNCMSAGSTNGQWSFDGFKDVSFDKESPNSFENQFNNLKNDLTKLIAIKKQGESKASKMLSCKVNIGAEYKMPFYDKLSVGALYSARFNNQYSMNEGRIFATVSPTNWFSFSGNYGIGECGSMLGLALNIHCNAVSLFFATDSIVTNYSPNFKSGKTTMSLPIDGLNVNAHLGLVVNLSRRRDR